MIELSELYATWRDVMDHKSDPRTAGWLFMSGPLPAIVMSASYIFMVKVFMQPDIINQLNFTQFPIMKGFRSTAHEKP